MAHRKIVTGRVRVKYNFLNRFKLIWAVQPYQQKIFRFRRRANQFYQLAPSHPLKGALAIVTNAGWDAMDAAALVRKVIAGRVSRERAVRAHDERRI